MKKSLTIFLLLGCCFVCIETNAQATAATTSLKGAAKSALLPIEGAWKTVDNKGFMMMNNGFFSGVSEDSTGMWKDTHAGTYTMDNNGTMTFKVLYSSFPTHVAALNTVDYDIKGETLTIKWFKKLIDPKAGDITAQMPKGTETQYIRLQK